MLGKVAREHITENSNDFLKKRDFLIAIYFTTKTSLFSPASSTHKTCSTNRLLMPYIQKFLERCSSFAYAKRDRQLTVTAWTCRVEQHPTTGRSE